jgi:hypothetical protein
MSRSGSVGQRKGPGSERTLQIARRLEHGAKDEGRPQRHRGKQPPAGHSRERLQVNPRLVVGDRDQLAIITIRTRRHRRVLRQVDEQNRCAFPPSWRGWKPFPHHRQAQAGSGSARDMVCLCAS